MWRDPENGVIALGRLLHPLEGLHPAPRLGVVGQAGLAVVGGVGILADVSWQARRPAAVPPAVTGVLLLTRQRGPHPELPPSRLLAVRGESAVLDEVAGEGYAVMTLEWGP